VEPLDVFLLGRPLASDQIDTVREVPAVLAQELSGALERAVPITETDAEPTSARS